MKNTKEMYLALLDGKRLHYEKKVMFYDETAQDFFIAEDSTTYKIYPNDYNPKNWSIKEEPKQITNRYKLMATINKWMREGKCFYVRATIINNYWEVPSFWSYSNNDPEYYQWTLYDEETGEPIGEPQEFVE